jgi:hypothetical protein
LSENLIDHPACSISEKVKIDSDKINPASKYIGAKLKLTDEQESLYGVVDFYELNGGHWPMLSQTKKLTEILNKL